MRKFYKKMYPKEPLDLSNGKRIRFQTFDGIWGYASTQDPEYQRLIQECIDGERGGVTEISADYYEQEFAKKKRAYPNYKPPPPNREELTAAHMQKMASRLADQNSQNAAGHAVAVEGSDIKKEEPIPPKFPESQGSEEEFQPNMGAPPDEDE